MCVCVCVSTKHNTNTFSGSNIILIPKHECESCDTFGKSTIIIIIIIIIIVSFTNALDKSNKANTDKQTQKPQIKEKV